MNADLQLADDLMKGVPGAFDRFVEIYHAKLFRYSYAMCRQRDDAEEVAQETLMKVFENLGQLRDPRSLRPWVWQIARNACFIRHRRGIFAPAAAQELSLDEMRPQKHGADGKIEIADWSALPETLASRAEVREALDKAVAALPDLYRAVFLLRDVEGLSTEEAARVLDVTGDVVKTRLHRARLALRQHLDTSLMEVASEKR